MTSRPLFSLPALLLLAGCYQVGSLPGTQVELIRVDARQFEVRLRPTDIAPNQWRLEINRATIVVNPDLELEGDRAREVAKRIMDRTCKGRPHNQSVDGMRGINYYTVFTCE
ncbi:hypothetical protein [Reyranella sp.]|uniref:hypothetical protein n=1 Tax=Reyranella sp. TaxID=1929291 RepID=UPI003D114106